MKKKHLIPAIASIGSVLVFILKFLANAFRDNLFGTFYSENIEPYLAYKIYLTVTKTHLRVQEGSNVILLSFSVLNTVLVITILTTVIWYFVSEKHKKNNNDEKINNVMDKLVRDNPDILAAQTYRFEIINGNKRKNKKRRIIVEHIASQYNSGMDINAIIHEEFEINERYYNAVTMFSGLFSRYEKTHNKLDKEVAEKNIESVLNTMKNELKISLDEITEHKCIVFSLYKGILSILEKESWDTDIDFLDREINQKLRNSKRTGCLPVILLQSAYIFRNGGSKFKGDRAYYTAIPDDSLLPNGYKNIFIIISLSYDLIEKKDENFLKNALYEKVNSYFEKEFEE